MNSGNTNEVVHNTNKQRFEIHLDGDIAVADYKISETTIIFTHTGVPSRHEGKGVGSKLARAALEYARSAGYRVQAPCSFIAAYIRRHPEYHAMFQGR